MSFPFPRQILRLSCPAEYRYALVVVVALIPNPPGPWASARELREAVLVPRRSTRYAFVEQRPISFEVQATWGYVLRVTWVRWKTGFCCTEASRRVRIAARWSAAGRGPRSAGGPRDPRPAPPRSAVRPGWDQRASRAGRGGDGSAWPRTMQLYKYSSGRGGAGRAFCRGPKNITNLAEWPGRTLWAV